MSIFRLSRREKALVRWAPITERPGIDRKMRVAVLRARRSKKLSADFAQQQAFDKAMAALVQTTPVSSGVEEWFRNETLIPQRSRRTWRKTVRNPAVLSIALALAVIAGVIVFIVMERMKEFPSSPAARKMLTIAASTRSSLLDVVDADAGSLGDLFFLKYRLEHYDVPPEFARLRATAYRVFDDDEGYRVAQIFIPSKRLQFFIFPAERNPKNGEPREFSGWRYVEQEGWTGAVESKAGVCFMAALHGQEKDLAPYLKPETTEPAKEGSGR
jgi:hypothetical protein